MQSTIESTLRRMFINVNKSCSLVDFNFGVDDSGSNGIVEIWVFCQWLVRVCLFPLVVKDNAQINPFGFAFTDVRYTSARTRNNIQWRMIITNHIKTPHCLSLRIITAHYNCLLPIISLNPSGISHRLATFNWIWWNNLFLWGGLHHAFSVFWLGRNRKAYEASRIESSWDLDA